MPETEIVLGDGFVVSISTEFIENESEDVTKNDYETKAFKRLVEKLKKECLCLNVFVLADSLAHIKIYWKNDGDMLELVSSRKRTDQKEQGKMKNISVQAKSCHGKRNTAKQMENI